MAKLDPKPYPGDWEMKFDTTDIQTEIRRTDALLDALLDKQPNSTAKSYVGAVLMFGVADGNAIYVVTKDRPLTLQHVPIGDAYCVDRCTMRGIDRQEVRDRLEFRERWGRERK